MTPSPTPPFMSGGCAIKERLDADFARLFFPATPERDHEGVETPSTSGGGSNNEVMS